MIINIISQMLMLHSSSNQKGTCGFLSFIKGFNNFSLSQLKKNVLWDTLMEILKSKSHYLIYGSCCLFFVLLNQLTSLCYVGKRSSDIRPLPFMTREWQIGNNLCLHSKDTLICVALDRQGPTWLEGEDYTPLWLLQFLICWENDLQS